MHGCWYQRLGCTRRSHVMCCPCMAAFDSLPNPSLHLSRATSLLLQRSSQGFPLICLWDEVRVSSSLHGCTLQLQPLFVKLWRLQLRCRVLHGLLTCCP